ncbi:MAG TPA: hypothetical protein VK459_25535 [Polyangiaceae bacterium]|nr:hypothetical protein [Polyangiaceae bacterium]
MKLDQLVSSLQQDIKSLREEGIAAKRLSSLDDGEGGKGDPLTLAALLVAVLPPFLPKLLEVLYAFSSRSSGTRVRIKAPNGAEIEFTSERPLSPDELIAITNRLAEAATPGAEPEA